MENWKNLMQDPFELEFQLRLADSDSLGHLSNVSFVEYLETMRTEWHANVRESRSALDHWDWILGGINITFRNEAYLSDTLKGYMWCSRIGGKSWDFSYAIVNQTGKLILEARTTQISYNYDAKTTIPIADDIKVDLTRRLGNPWPTTI